MGEWETTGALGRTHVSAPVARRVVINRKNNFRVGELTVSIYVVGNRADTRVRPNQCHNDIKVRTANKPVRNPFLRFSHSKTRQLSGILNRFYNLSYQRGISYLY